MKCPNCRNEVRVPRPNASYWAVGDAEQFARNQKWGGITCENCPAIMRISYRESDPFILLGFIWGFFIVLVPTLLYVARLSELALVFASLFFVLILGSAALAYNKRRLEVVGMRQSCEYCGAIMESENTRFCPKCGSSMTKRAQGAPQEVQQNEFPATERIGTCMVCNLGLRISDLLAWCPHCGNPAHRDHLLEWVHVKGRCPSCGEHLNEREINLKTTEKPAGLERRKRIWRTI